MPSISPSSRVLITNTLSFAAAFAAWVALGPAMRTIAHELQLTPTSATLLKVAPILVGSVFRVPIGIATDRFGARVLFPAALFVGSVAIGALSLLQAYALLVCAALLLGVVGTTFVVGVQSVSAWTDSKRQGAALGIFGAGNAGTAVTTLLFPLLATAWGWRGAFRCYALVLLLTAVGYRLVTPKPASQGRGLSLGARLAPLKSRRAWRLGLYYTATFGAFVAATLGMSEIYTDAYGVSAKTAGLLATSFTLTASLIRIVGGRLSDRFGARRTLQGALLGIAASLSSVPLHLGLVATVGLVFTSAVFMGIGMAAVFRYIPDCFPRTVGAVGGIVGAVGGLGGFVLPFLGQWTKGYFHDPLLGILPLPILAALALTVQTIWVRLQRDPDTRAGHFSMIPAE